MDWWILMDMGGWKVPYGLHDVRKSRIKITGANVWKPLPSFVKNSQIVRIFKNNMSDNLTERRNVYLKYVKPLSPRDAYRRQWTRSASINAMVCYLFGILTLHKAVLIYSQMDHSKQYPMKFVWKHSLQKINWKCRLQNSHHFVQVTMGYNLSLVCADKDVVYCPVLCLYYDIFTLIFGFIFDSLDQKDIVESFFFFGRRLHWRFLAW